MRKFNPRFKFVHPLCLWFLCIDGPTNLHVMLRLAHSNAVTRSTGTTSEYTSQGPQESGALVAICFFVVFTGVWLCSVLGGFVSIIFDGRSVTSVFP